ncbi:glycosyltransferase [Pontibacter arcticus]|uniref:Uncharacterized protein n=1 Tax=Pontibacter arcticus TaxID=2080288 RepID=A0A364RFE1_9BACT|nr:glycosyltransferase [Pontibacter arcticus]RAU82992.1 hypothetical protein DP923_07065 [Pontibacter arcticus]
MAFKVILISKAMLVSSTHSKAELIGKFVDLTLITPFKWPYYVEEELKPPGSFKHIKVRTTLEGKNHLHFYWGIEKIIKDINPDIVHIDEEPFSLVTGQILRICKKLNIKTLCFTWENLFRNYPFPFNHLKQYVLNNIDYVIAGNEEAVEIVKKKGYNKNISVIPQFGIDTTTFYPRAIKKYTVCPDFKLSVGFVGRVIEEKGIQTVINAMKNLPSVHLTIIGTGPYQTELQKILKRNHIENQVKFLGGVSSTDVAEHIASFDTLILPSLTGKKWKEQFGRVLPEAMACKVAVIGSSSGEIPNVIGNAGLVFEEGNVAECKKCINSLLNSETLHTYQEKGYQRALAYYTQESIVDQTIKVYKEIV